MSDNNGKKEYWRWLEYRKSMPNMDWKVDIVRLVQALVLGFRLERVRSLSGLRRAYRLMTGESLARSSFHERFTDSLVELMRRLTLDALERTSASRPRLRNAFRPFVEVLAVDSSLVRLHAGLKKEYPSVWTNHTMASAKLFNSIQAEGGYFLSRLKSRATRSSSEATARSTTTWSTLSPSISKARVSTK